MSDGEYAIAVIGGATAGAEAADIFAKRGVLVVVFEQDTPLELLRRVRPKMLAKGGDYRREEVVGHELVEGDGGEVILIDLVPGFSTTEIVRKSRAPQSG